MISPEKKHTSDIETEQIVFKLYPYISLHVTAITEKRVTVNLKENKERCIGSYVAKKGRER